MWKKLNKLKKRLKSKQNLKRSKLWLWMKSNFNLFPDLFRKKPKTEAEISNSGVRFKEIVEIYDKKGKRSVKKLNDLKIKKVEEKADIKIKESYNDFIIWFPTILEHITIDDNESTLMDIDSSWTTIETDLETGECFNLLITSF